MKDVEQIFYLVLFYYVVHISYYPTVFLTEYKYPTILYSWLLYSTVRGVALPYISYMGMSGSEGHGFKGILDWGRVYISESFFLEYRNEVPDLVSLTARLTQ